MRLRPPLSALTALALLGAGSAGAAPRAWVATWGSAQMPATEGNALPPALARDVTLRQIVRISSGGARLRIRLSNTFGTAPLVIDAASLARSQGGGTIADPTPLRFDGKPGVTIAAGAQRWSDPVALTLAPRADVAISLHLAQAPAPQTVHPGARARSFAAPGNRVAATDLPAATPIEHWYAIADLDAEAAPGAAAIVAIGDSITDGYGLPADTSARWTDTLATRLAADPATRALGLVNAGIGGNRILRDGLGPSLVTRFDRDVLSRSGVRHIVLLEGVNDLGMLTRDAPAPRAAHAAIIADILRAYRDLVGKAHAKGIRVTGATITPFAGNDYYHPGPETEADRQAINTFIRTSGVFDSVIDFDALMRDPTRPDRLAPRYDSGDHLHPSVAGYRAMGEAVPLTLFAAQAGKAAPAPAPVIALTFDDLPAHGPLPPGATRLEVVDTTIASLKREGVPATGFVNGRFGADDATAPAVLVHWRAAGLPVGNHSFSHAGLDTLGTRAFIADIDRNEPVLGTSATRRFRYPFLDEGRDAATRAHVRAALATRGYTVAAVTMSFGDYAWNAPYARCVAKHDDVAIAGLERSYLAAARLEAKRMRTLSRQLYARDIPYVLLMHLGAFDARMLPRLLAQYRDMGFAFTTLDTAQRDPFYRAATDLTLPGPSPTLTGAAQAKGIAVPAGATLPDDTVCG